jgi:hypothetical protein
MKTEPAAKPVRLHTPADIVDAVPHLVGFQPADSLVFISLRGARSRLGLVARFDLPEPRYAEECVEYMAGHLAGDGANRALFVFYPPTDGTANESVQAIFGVLSKRFPTETIELADAICVYDDRWWSLLCKDSECCPAEGTAIDRVSTSTLAAEMAVQGHVTLGSREELDRTLDPVGGLAAAAMTYALMRSTEEFASRVVAGGLDELEDEALALYRAAVEARVSADGAVPALTTDDAARLIVALADVNVRDEILTWVDDEWGRATQALFAELVTRAMPGFEAAPLTVLAWLSYLNGNGALAGMAIDRALDADPDYNLALLIDSALTGGLNPQRLRPMIDNLRETMKSIWEDTDD